MRRPPAWVVDVGLAVGVAVTGVLPTGHPHRWAYPLAFAAGLALVLRRRFPRLVLLAAFPALIGQLGTIAAGAALYSLGRLRPAPRALVPWVGLTMVVSMLPVVYVKADTGYGPREWGDWVVTVLVVLLITGGPPAAGALMSTKRELAASLAALRAAEADRDAAKAAKVRADERARIARDVHDIVGHYASLIAVQASAMESWAPDDEVRRTAATVRELSSRALDEMRAAVTDWVDRVDEPIEGGWTKWVLQPAVAAGAAGVDVRIERSEALPGEVAEHSLRVLRRVVQEGVTNAVKHSPGAEVRIALGSSGSTVQVEVRNAVENGGTPGNGSGLPGLSDRIGPLGGTFSAGPDGEGEWLLAASVPVSVPMPRGRP